MVQFILYVSSQQRSRDFYKNVLKMDPLLDVPGMTEFTIYENCCIGLMPEGGIAEILGVNTPHPSKGSGIPRCEIYLHVNDPVEYYNIAVKSGAKEISPVKSRGWGDIAGYVSDPDGHILVFARTINETD